MADQLEIDDLALDLDELEVAAVRLKPRPQFLELRLDLLFHRCPPVILRYYSKIRPSLAVTFIVAPGRYLPETISLAIGFSRSR